MARIGTIVGAACVILSACIGCGQGDGGSSASPGSATAPEGTIDPTTSASTPAGPTTQPSGGGGTATASESLTEVTSTIAGAAVAGNSGGDSEDQTMPLSEVVRLGTGGGCAGWRGPGDAGRWTQGVEDGAELTVLDLETGAVIGTGALGSSFQEDVGTGGRSQWMCVFPFEVTINGPPTAFRIQVAGLEPWEARPDPTSPGHVVASVSTRPEAARVSECTGEPPAQVIPWESAVVGQYWSAGLETLCGAGLRVARFERPCRPPAIGSDHIVSVVDAEDPSVVLEDSSGIAVDAGSAPAPGTRVIVRVATGIPCG